MKTIIILGASSSIGKAIFNQFNNKDNKLISTYFSGDSPDNIYKNDESFCVDLDIHKAQINSGKLLNEEDLAKIIFDLCQDHWNHLNGACIDLNGGQYVR